MSPVSDHQQLIDENQRLRALLANAEQRLNELTQHAERLGEGDRRFRTIFERSSVANKIINADLEILEVNQAVADLLGYAKEEIVGAKIRDFSREDFDDRWHMLQEELWTKQVPSFKFEVCLIKKDKTEVWCIINSIIFKDQDQTLGYTVLEDITERKNKELAKDEVLGVVSHELKTPVASLKGYTQVLARLFKSESNTTAGVMLKKMSVQVIKLTRLIHDLLDVTRMEAGSLPLNLVTYSFNELLTEVVDNIRLATDYQVELAMAADIRCHGDKGRIEQVLINMITNAIKYSPGKDKVVVRLERKEAELVCSVQDFGIGIPLKKQEQLFDRYYRVKNDETQNISGLGLGLYISAQVVRQHEGRIWVESKEGEGSTFYVSLPCLD